MKALFLAVPLIFLAGCSSSPDPTTSAGPDKASESCVTSQCAAGGPSNKVPGHPDQAGDDAPVADNLLPLRFLFHKHRHMKTSAQKALVELFAAFKDLPHRDKKRFNLWLSRYGVKIHWTSTPTKKPTPKPQTRKRKSY